MPPRLPPVATPTEGRSVLGGSYGRCPFASDAPFVRQTLRYAFPHEGAPRSSGDPADGVLRFRVSFRSTPPGRNRK